MSDEATKRRELRKQRILGNSESRLRIILNKNELPDAGGPAVSNGGSEATKSASSCLPGNEFIKMNRPVDDANRLLSSSSQFSLPAVDSSPASLSSGFGDDNNDQFASLNSASAYSAQGLIDLESLANGPNSIDLLSRLASRLDTSNCLSGQLSKQESDPAPAFLRDSTNSLRIRVLFLLGIVSRFLLPSLPSDFAKMFALFYLLELLLFSLCIVYKASLAHSSVSPLYSLMALLGIHPGFVKLGKLFSSFLEMLLRDMWYYSFSFFVTHALCQQLEIFNE